MNQTPILCIHCDEIITIDASQQNSDTKIICTKTNKKFVSNDLPKYNTGVANG